MNLKLKKIIAYTATTALAALPLMTLAGEITPAPNLAQIQTNTGLGSSSPIDVVMSVIQFVLGLLGLVSIIIVIMGGFRWMTAAGNDENIKKAKKVLFAGLTGLVIVLVGFGVVQFVVTQLQSTTGGTKTF